MNALNLKSLKQKVIGGEHDVYTAVCVYIIVSSTCFTLGNVMVSPANWQIIHSRIFEKRLNCTRRSHSCNFEYLSVKNSFMHVFLQLHLKPFGQPKNAGLTPCRVARKKD